MQISLINPYVRLATQSIVPSGHNIARRVIYDYELIYLEKGELTFVYDGESYFCQAGDFIFIRPGIPHSFQLDHGEISQPHIHFDITHSPKSEKIPISFKDFNVMTETERSWIHRDYFYRYPPYPFITIPDKSAFLDEFFTVISKDTSPLAKKAIMTRLLSIIIEANFPDTLDGEERLHGVVYQVRDYIDAGNGFEMSLDDFAKYFFQSKFYLDKKFKKEFGFGLIEYRDNKRMELAVQLLKTQSVTEVAEELGYQSIYSFSRAYKRHFGQSPNKYKRSSSAVARE